MSTVRFTVFGIEVCRLDIDTPATPRTVGPVDRALDTGRGLALRLAKWVIR